MKLKKLDPQLRKKRVLTYVVEQYIQSVTPISSKQIVSSYFYDLSPATIRNVLAELEEEGFLTHPHTSSGRIPTQDGYRYYVDHLMNEIQLLSSEKERIQAEYAKGVRELEILLATTSQLLAHETLYPSIISIDGKNTIFCHGMSFVARYPEFHDFQRIQHILNVLEEKEQLLDVINKNLEKKINIYIGNEIDCLEMQGCSLIVSRYGKKDGPSGRLALLGPTRMNYEKVVSTLEYVSQLINEMI